MVLRSAKQLATQFDVNVTTINTIWHTTKSKIDAGLNIVQNGAPVNYGATINALINDVTFYQSGRKLSGGPRKWDVRDLQEEVRGMPLVTSARSCVPNCKGLSIFMLVYVFSND
jgi:hypothetical protein